MCVELCVCVCVFVINRLDSFSFFWLKNDCRPTKPILHLWESWRRPWHCWKLLSRSFKLHSVASVDWNLFMQHIPRFWAKGQHLWLDFVNTTNNANPFLFSLYLCFPSGKTHLYFNFYFKIFKYLMYSNQQKSIKLKTMVKKNLSSLVDPTKQWLRSLSSRFVLRPSLPLYHKLVIVEFTQILNLHLFFLFSAYQTKRIGQWQVPPRRWRYEIINVTHFNCHNQFTTCFQNLFLSFLH